MNTTTLTTSITIPKMDLSLLKDLAKKFGWTINNAPANKPGLEEALDNVKNGNIRAVLTGRIVRVCLLTQGVALGYVLLPLRGVPLTTFCTPSSCG